MAKSAEVDILALCDLATPWCVHVVSTLGVAEAIAAGKTGIGELAATTGSDADALCRVLRHLAGKGLFEEPEPGRFALNEPARALLDRGARLSLDLNGFGSRMAIAWTSLLEAVQTGAPAYHTVFGRPFWDDLQAHPEIAARFDELMGPTGHGKADPDVLLTGGWDSVQTVVDVGGGTGTLLAEVLLAHPSVQGILVDQPATTARAENVFKEAGVADRASCSGQSFFDPLPPGADLYLLKSVLADWPDREATAILSRCAEAARPHGRVVLVNGVSPDEDGPANPELLMLVLVGGRQRTLAEFRTLARAAGLEVEAAGRNAAGRFLVQCRPDS